MKEGIAHDLYEAGRVSDLLLYSWGSAEMMIDLLMRSEFSLTISDEDKVEFLLSKSFKSKIDFLKKIGKLTKDEFTIFDNFRITRNHLFHTLDSMYHMSLFIEQDNPVEKKKIMDLALLVADTALNLIKKVATVIETDTHADAYVE